MADALYRESGIGENRTEMLAVKWVAEGMVKGESRVFHDEVACVSCRGYDCIPPRAWNFTTKLGWHRELCLIRPW